MISAAFFWPIPWMYWSAISTRLLVGIFTPAIRATQSLLSPTPRTGCVFSYSGRVSTNANTTPVPLLVSGPGIVWKQSDWIPGLLKDSTWFRQPSLAFSSLLRDLFCGFFGFGGPSGRGGSFGLAGRLFGPLWGRFPGLCRRFGSLFGGACGLGRRPGGLRSRLFGG